MSAARKNGVDGHPRTPPGGAPPGPPPLDVARLLAGRRLLVSGSTGFVGKVALSMLLHRYPGVGKVYALVRPGTGGTAEERFFGKVAGHRPFDPLREVHGARYLEFLREKVVPLPGDVSAPRFGLKPEHLELLAGLDLVVNSAGLVDFDPSLELALGVNVKGARNAVELCRTLGAGLVHVSTCFVAGNRDGVVFEDEPVVGYFPRRAGGAERTKGAELEPEDFAVETELSDAEKRLAEVRGQAEDRVLQSQFRERARERLREAGRPLDDEKALRLAIGREKRLWISGRLVALGMERARHWGWPNTYTYTKSLGEQAIAASDVLHAIVRPSIVESALRYPFPGWNEGFTTSAPLAFMGLRGHRTFPMAERAILDVVPVDLVAAGTLMAAAELQERRLNLLAGGAGGDSVPRSRIYHLASGDVNPLWARRAVELTGLYRRRFFRGREEGNATWNQVLSRIEPRSRSRAVYQAFSTPALLSLARGARRLLEERAPRWGTPRLSALLHGAEQELDEWTRKFERTEAMWKLYMPFVWENRYVFRCAGVRALRDRLTPEDRARLPWDPEALDWRKYWMEVHMKGMEEWVFPALDEEAEKKVHAPKAHRDLLELLDAAVEEFGDRTALRMGGAVKDRLTYRELRRLSDRVASFLASAGVGKGDRVVLASENRPEWAVAYFGVLRAGAAAVPVDAELTAPELLNLWKSSGARLALASDEVLERLPELGAGAAAAGDPPGARLVPLGEALRGGPTAPAVRPSADDLASLIFTSGTTGTPKGVMLSHRNFASLVAKLDTVFDLRPSDALLSVLPLHHTFEFACGLLVPLSRGAEVEYLDELTSDRIGEALSSGRVTAMIGVPALWSLLHRKITQELAARPGLVEEAFALLRRGNEALRDSRLGWNVGKALFWPIHRKLGGRLRFLVSGGSALDPELQEVFRGLGLDLYQGYGLTEAAPVLAVGRPGEAPAGSVGPALAGVELRIADPDAGGVGEVLARGPNVMLGYWRGGERPGLDEAATAEVLEDGWLRTGDLGRLDEAGNLILVGRKKDVIIEASGKNVHPDEVEERYRAPLLRELCCVGLPDGSAEKVALLVVPEWGDRPRAEVRAEVEAHLRAVSAALPFHLRARVWHLTEQELPKTASRKVKRAAVREELRRLEAAAARGAGARRAREERGGDGWLLDLVAEVSRRPREAVGPAARLQADLGFDSLMLTELTAALEEAGVSAHLAEQLHAVQTVEDLSRLVAGAVRRGEVAAAAPRKPPRKEAPDAVEIPPQVSRLGRRLLSAGQRLLYHGLYETAVVGAAHVPHDRAVLVVANHQSHLDMGLVKIALAEEGERLAALAARDYFFDTRLKRTYFQNFTNLIPMDREGSLKTSLRSAVESLRRGYHLLIFPESTRSRDGELHPFFPTAGYLALTAEVDVLPVHLSGTWEALPPGARVPRRTPLEVRIGPVIPLGDLRAAGEGAATRGETYRRATRLMEAAVQRLRAEARPRPSTPRPPAAAATLRASGEEGTPGTAEASGEEGSPGTTEASGAGASPAMPRASGGGTSPARPERSGREATAESKGAPIAPEDP